jgi:hypothetical protein
MILLGNNNISSIYLGTNPISKAYLGVYQVYSADFDPDYQEVLDLGTFLGYDLPSSGQQILQNQLMLAAKASGAYQKSDVFGIFANDGSPEFGLIDWKRKSTMTAVNSPSFTSNQGFTGNGSTSYIDTNYNPFTNGVNHTLNDASRYYLHYAGTSNIVDGIDLVGANQALSLSNSAVQRINSTNSLNSAFTYTTTRGVKSIHRTSATDVALYNDKVGASRTQTSTAMPSNNQFVLRRFVNYSTNTTWGYIMGASMISENDDFVDALNNYINSI